MEDNKIKKIIKEINENQHLEEEAYVGFFNEENDYLHIKANKKGILKLVIELLNIYILFNYHLSKVDHYSIIPIKRKLWLDSKSHVVFDYFKPINKSRNEIFEEQKINNKKSYMNRISNFLGLLFLCFLLISLIVGIINLSNWFINLF